MSSTSDSSRFISFVALDRQTVAWPDDPIDLTDLTAEKDGEQLEARRLLALDVVSMSFRNIS